MGLNSSYSTVNNEGISIGMGMSIPLGLFNIFADLNYIFVNSITEFDDEVKVNVGGLKLGYGITINLWKM